MADTKTKMDCAGMPRRDERRGRIRKRSASPGDERRTHKLTVRMTHRVSAELASMQGLCYAYGRRETIAALFETVALPAIKAHIAPYAERARAARELARAEAGSECPAA